MADNAQEPWTPPVVFYFRVAFHGEAAIPDTSFTEVSGLQTELEIEQVKEGGENYFIHQLPMRIKHGNLVLKRALEPMNNALEKWVRENLESGFAKGFKPVNVEVTLLNSEGGPLGHWLCANAYPVKWEISRLNARENELVIETLELNYNSLTRTE